MIALLHGAPAFGAVEEYIAAVARGLREREIEALLIVPAAEAVEPLVGLQGGSLCVETFPVELLDRTPALLGRLTRSLRRSESRLAHVMELWPAATLAARLAGVRRVVMTHHTPALPRHDNLAGRAWLAASWLARPTVVYTSESDRRADGRRLVRRRVIPLGIDVERFTVPAVRDGRAPVVGNVARLVHQKGQDILIDAVPLVLEQRPDARFAIVGDGPERASLEARARSLGVDSQVRFTGATADVPSELSKFSVFAFPSRFEGLCLAVIEAQAAGVPVVATQVGGIRETVVDGMTGLLVPADDPAALAERIVRLLDQPDLAERLASAARQQAQGFTVERMVERTIALYGDG